VASYGFGGAFRLRLTVSVVDVRSGERIRIGGFMIARWASRSIEAKTVS
jgi:hypothetical protein